MKNITLLLLFGILALSLIIPVALAGAASVGSVTSQAATATPATSANTNITNVPAVQGTPTSPTVVVWDQFCVKKVPYTLLAVAENATFEVKPPDDAVVMPTPNVRTGNTNEIVCESAGIFRGKQVIVCRGPELWSFNISITDGGQSDIFPVPLKACPNPQITSSSSK